MVSVCSYPAIRPPALWDRLQVSCRRSVFHAWSCHRRRWALFLFSIHPRCPGRCPLLPMLSQARDPWILACLASDQELIFSSALLPWLIQNHRRSPPQTLSFRVRTHLTWVRWCQDHTASSSPSPPFTEDIQPLWWNYNRWVLRFISAPHKKERHSVIAFACV